MRQFTNGQKLSGRSICDYDCLFSGTVIKRTANYVTIINPHGKHKRCKIYNDDDGEYIFPLGKYSMAPIFRA